MKGFDYSLENVLKFRMKVEDDKLLDFVKAKNSYLENLKSVEEIEAVIAKAGKPAKACEGNRLEFIKSQYYYLESLRRKKDKREHQAKEAGKTCEIRRMDYENAQIKRKTIEIHREKQLESYKKKQRKEEEQMLDEIAVAAFKRKLEL